MRKLIIGINLMLALGLMGCGQKAQETPNINNNEIKKETKVESEFKFPEGQSQVGKGTIYVSTPSGTSENNNVPIVMVEKDTALIQIGLNANNFDGSKISYVYINKKFIEKMQLGEMSQTSLNLQENLLSSGVYTVSVAQFDNDDPSTGKVTQFAETKYEVKEL